MKKHDHIITKSYEFSSNNFERFLHDAMQMQNNIFYSFEQIV